MSKTSPNTARAEHTCCYHVEAARFVCAERERELLELKGACSTESCRLHYAHSGPCDTTPSDRSGPELPVRHASPGCACGVNDIGQRYVDPICRPLTTSTEEPS